MYTNLFNEHDNFKNTFTRAQTFFVFFIVQRYAWNFFFSRHRLSPRELPVNVIEHIQKFPVSLEQ